MSYTQFMFHLKYILETHFYFYGRAQIVELRHYVDETLVVQADSGDRKYGESRLHSIIQTYF